MAGVNGDNEVPEEETTTPPTQKDLRDATTWKKQRSAVRQQITKTIRYLGNLVNERGSRGSISSLMKHLEKLLATAAKIHTNLSTVEDQAENDRQDEFHLKYVELAGDALERGQQYLNSRLGEPPSVIAGKKAPSISPSEQNRQEEERQLAQQRADAAILQADEARRQANEAANRADQARREATAAQQALQNLENDDDDTSAVTNLSQHLSQLGFISIFPVCVHIGLGDHSHFLVSPQRRNKNFGNGDIPGNRNTSELRQNATNDTRLVHQCSPVAFVIPDRSSTPIAPVACSVRFSTPTSSPHTATHLPSSVLIHPNVATAADHLYGESEVLVIQEPRSSNAQPTKVEETTRFLILRQKFLAGLDLPTKFKVRYKHFKVYEDLVRETDKYDQRLEAEKEEFRKRKFVNDLTSPLSQSASHLIWQAIETQNEKINAITSMSRFNTDPPDAAIELIPNEDLTNRIMEILHHLIAYQQMPLSAHQHLHPFNSPTLNVQSNEANHFSLARVARKMINANGERGSLMPYYNHGALGHQPSSCSYKEPITCGLAEGQMGITV
ncbi:hypothetical protein DAPPUDRAFT_324903 [Daphnia pulex]|uniref:Uncharacterized protein n=1 Tax=Daphnia pulex TaxID=6669 RepID=E9H340_DAPPU|nr:hypothetical protein DAPPUDRAFT_324903 [Daphnia pulex]|eukprot:EFX73901.1 hypothetical protein DAPPUDRAFT_324903 [Daphnia pulex]